MHGKDYLEKERYHNNRESLRSDILPSYRLSVVVQKDAHGYYAFCPELQGCYTQGDSYEDVMENLRDAILLHLEDRIENGEEIPTVESITLTSLEVSV